MVKVSIKPKVFAWAVERAGEKKDALYKSFAKLGQWIEGTELPTYKQLEQFAKRAYVPLGYLFLDEPPEESVPIPDFRTMGDQTVRKATPDLLDVIYTCQLRQEWYSEFLKQNGDGELDFVGSVSITDSPENVAAKMSRQLSFSVANRPIENRSKGLLRELIDRAEDSGIHVMVSGIVGSNTSRQLNPKEFRGFTLIDKLAPVIFLTGTDSKSAQMFTLAHELAHIWLGQSAVSNPELESQSEEIGVERWCNQVAAEFLVPVRELEKLIDKQSNPIRALDQMKEYFGVSSLVILRRLFDAKYISWHSFRNEYEARNKKDLEKPIPSGGDFYKTHPLRIGRRFARSVIESTLEGSTLYRDAFRLLGITSEQTFRQLGKALEVIAK